MSTSADILTLARAKKGRPKVRSDQQQKEIIVEKAYDLFLKAGFAAMRMDDVAADCGISKRTLYRLFPSKLDLFRSLVEFHRQSMLAFPESLALMPLEEALAELFRIDLDPQSDFRRLAFVQRTSAEARQVPELGEILHSEGSEMSRRLLAEWLAERKAKDAMHIGDPSSAASILMDMVFGSISLKPADTAYWPGGADRKAYLRDCIHYFVNGVK